MPSSPTVDTSGTATGHGVSSISFSVTTSGANEVIALFICNASIAGNVRTVSSITGATFARYGAPWSGTTTTQFAGTQSTEIEIWTAPIATASTVNITVNFSGNVGGAVIPYYAIAGTYSGSAYLDPNAGLPANGGVGFAPPLVTFSTTLADDLLWNLIMSGYTGTYGTGPAGWGGGPGAVITGADYEIQIQSYDKSVSTTQSGASTGNPSNSPLGPTATGISFVLAFTADAAIVPLQTFVTMICT